VANQVTKGNSIPSKAKPSAAKAPSAHRARRRYVWGGSAVVAAAAAVTATMLLMGPAQSGLATAQEVPHPTTIPAMAPADSDTFVVAPYSKEWWDKVASMTSPETGLVNLDPSKAGGKMLNIGYSRSQDHVTRDVKNTGALRIFYVEAGSDADADAVAQWLREADGFEGRRVFVQGRVLLVLPSWGAQFEPPKETMASVPGYKADITSGTAAMWRNVDKDVSSLVSDPKSPRAEALSTVMTKGYGFRPGTTWIGTSKSGDDWSGSFKAGGVDAARIDFKATQKVLSESEKVLAKYEFKDTSYQFIDKGVGDVLASASFVAPSQTIHLGTDSVSAVSSVKDPAITARTDVSQFNAAASGIDSTAEKISTQTVSANANEMVISYEFAH